MSNSLSETETGITETAVRLHVMRAHFLLPMVLLLLVGPQNALAQSGRAQPILGFAWPTHSVPVSVETPQSNVKLAVLNAMRTWNLAQQWFITTYMANQGAPLIFYPTNSTFDSMITVTFNQTQTREDLGWTSMHEFHDKQGVFRKVIVHISIDLASQDGKALSNSELQTLATHELGHALGLDHTTFSTSDLMNHTPEFTFPSTLNLYAVYELSRATSISNLPQQPVTLPTYIPYGIVSQAELDTVTPPAIQNATTSSWLTQFASIIINVSRPYISIWTAFVGVVVALALAGVVVGLIVCSRKTDAREANAKGPELISLKNPVAELAPVRTDRAKKECRYCGAQIPRDGLTCRECGMPAIYLDTDPR